MRNNATIRVLVVDGSRADREHLGALLRARGIEVICASHGAEAIEIARRSPPSIVVADFLMAGPNGDTLLHLWKADPLLREIPFIASTAPDIAGDDDRLAHDLGADACLDKPVQSDDLTACLGAVLRSGDVRRPAQANDALRLRQQLALLRRLETETVKAERGEAIGTLVDTVIHEFNNILGVILGNAEMAAMEHATSASVRASVEEILKAGQRGRRLVQDIRERRQQHLPAANGPAATEVTPQVKADLVAAPVQGAGRPNDSPDGVPEERGRRILYIDDDEGHVFVAVRMLTALAYRVRGFVHAEEALAILRADPFAFDLVVTDYNMPRVSGLEVAKEVALVRPDLPVMVTTGHLSDELRATMARAGVRFLIEKPERMEALCALVRDALRSTAHD